MLSNKEQRERKSRMAAVAGTILFHALLLLILHLLTLRTTLPLPAEQGVEVEIGYNDDGTGNIKTEVSNAGTNDAALQKKAD